MKSKTWKSYVLLSSVMYGGYKTWCKKMSYPSFRGKLFYLDYESTKTLKNWQESRHSLGGSKTLFGLGRSRSLEKEGRDFVPPFLLRSLGGRLSQQVTMYLWIQHNFRWCKSNYSLSYLCPCSCVLLNYNYKHGIFDYLLIVEQKQFHGLFRHKGTHNNSHVSSFHVRWKRL